jgi:AraC-like DNA-binding protein
VRAAYATLLAADELSGLHYPEVDRNLFAGAWKELSDPSFRMPPDLARSCGRLFSYRSEEPDLPLHLKVTEYEAAAPGGKGQHGHDFYELVLLRSGAGMHLHGRHEYPVYSGDCFIVTPGQTHGYITRTRLAITNVIFYEECLAPYANLLAELPGFTGFFAVEPLFRGETSFRHKLHLSVPQLREALGWCDRIRAELRQRRPGCHMAALAHFLQLVVFISRVYGDAARSGQTMNDLPGKQKVVGEAIAHLEANSTRGVSVPELARGLFLSQSRLQHLFKETTGMSLLEYLLQVRIDHACALLRDTRLPIVHIAGQVGFHDRAYFTRQFRNRTGETPMHYRRTHAGG